MKKTIAIYFTVFLLSILAYVTVNAQTRKTFYYYPTQNVYYDVTAKQYLFNNAGTWSSTKTLPSGVVLTKSDSRVTVYHPGNDVWVNNSGHMVKYKSHGNANSGKMKAKSPGNGKTKKH
jgi:hypothetical protein